VLVQDVTLSVLASLLSVLLVRWISEPIPGFTSIVTHWLLAALAGTLLGLPFDPLFLGLAVNLVIMLCGLALGSKPSK
jgi:hypothetical protein